MILRRRIPILFLISFLLFQGICVFFFLKGFFLARYVLLSQSECETLPLSEKVPNVTLMSHSEAFEEENRYCWQKPTFSRAVVIIFDAWRYDFPLYNVNSEDDREVPKYVNKMKRLHSLMENHPEHSALFSFVADPPTATAQRIKGLTTGSLPTFADILETFGSTQIVEDSWIHQMKQNLGRTVFVGDDTWMDLYPRDSFVEVNPYPCFNVKDLYTVDNGCNEVLFSELKGEEWEVIVAHYLGLDHCAHTFGLDVDCMEERLVLYDEIVYNVTRLLPDDSLLIVFGDHGITQDGAHGGASQDELEAALFIYSKGGPIRNLEVLERFYPEKEGGRRKIPQIDLVPSISLALGLPIPFSNLGFIIPEFFGPSGEEGVLHAAWLAVRQVYNYILAYSSEYAQIDQESLSSIESHFSRCNDDVLVYSEQKTAEAANAAFECLRALNERMTEVCRKQWIDFDVKAMVLGISGLTALLLLSVVVAIHSLGKNKNILPHGIESFSIWASAISALLIGGLMSNAGGDLGIDLGVSPPILIYVVLIAGVSLYMVITAFSLSSFSVTSDALFSIIVLLVKNMAYYSDSFVIYDGLLVHFFTASLCLATVGMGLRKGVGKNFYIVAAATCICIRISSEILSLENGIETNPYSLFFFFKYLSMSLLAAIGVRLGLSGTFLGRENSSVLHKCWKIGSVLARAALASLYMLLSDFNVIHRQEYQFLRLYIPRALYLFSLISLLGIIVNPTIGRRGTSPLVAYFEIFVFVNPVLLGSRFIIQYFLMLIQVAMVFCLVKLGGYDLSSYLLLFPVVAFAGLLSEQFFYLFGHSLKFSSIHFVSGFVGYEDFMPVINGTLIMLETYAGEMGVLFLLIALISMGRHTKEERRHILLRTMLFRMTMETGRLVASTGSAFYLRRHLMVFKVFAPMLFFHIIAAMVIQLGNLIISALILV